MTAPMNLATAERRWDVQIGLLFAVAVAHSRRRDYDGIAAVSRGG